MFGPLLVGKSSPTASLYFENACADWLTTDRVEKIAPTVFATDTTQVIFRHNIRVPNGFSRPRTIYFMDDYWRPDPNLPLKYRIKSALVEQRAARLFMPKSRAIVVSSVPLAEQAKQEFPNIPVHKIAPFWSEPLADLSHFDSSTLEICFLGAQSHARDLRLIIPAISVVLQQFPQAWFSLSAGHMLPANLAQHPQIRRIPATGWEQYRREIIRHRFHIALYPLLDGKFNVARSLNKLTEHAVVGAATLCSDTWLSGTDRVIATSNSEAQWVQKLCDLARDRARQKAVAQANLTAVNASNLADAQRQLWAGLLWPK